MGILNQRIVSWLKFIRLYKTRLNAFLLWKSIKKNPAIITLNDGAKFLVRPGIPDIQMINEIYIAKEYRRNLNKIGKKPMIVDIGGNIGSFSVFISRLIKDARVFVFEPFPDNFKILKKNIEINHLQDRIEPFQLGVAKSKSKRKLFLGKLGNATHSLFEKSEKSIIIKTVSLQDILKEIKFCDFLKIDCEGAEYEIILNTNKKVLDNIKIISMEYHKNGDPIKIIKHLKKAGFNVTLKKSDLEGFGFIDAWR